MTVANVFAILYVAAQVIERIAEVLKNTLPYYDKTKAKIETCNFAIEDQKKIIEKARNNGEDVSYNKLEELMKKKNYADNKIILHLFIFTAILGILGAFLLKIRFLALLEVKNVDPTLDLIITGLVIGSGTKPLHDLIKYIQKAKD